MMQNYSLWCRLAEHEGGPRRPEEYVNRPVGAGGAAAPPD